MDTVEIFKNEDYKVFVKSLEKNSIDFICIDPPYGKIKGMQLSGQNKAVDWDVDINWKKMFDLFRTILKPGGTIAVFGQNPTYSKMIISNYSEYKYEYIWKKNNAAQGFHANKMPLNFSENIAIFIKKGGKRTFNKPNNIMEIDKSKHFSRWYAQKIVAFINKSKRQIHRDMGHRKLEFYFTYNGKHFGICSEELYDKLISLYNIDKADFFMPYRKIKEIWDKEKSNEKGVSLDSSKYCGTFSNILEYKKDYKPYYHPTQKPIKLMKLLVSIYTKKGDSVLDCFAGSGSTLLAAKLLGRSYYGCEIDKNFYNVALKRLNKN